MKKIMLFTILASFLLLAGCSAKEEVVNKNVPRTPGTTYEATESGFVLVGSGENMELYLDAETATLRWMNKNTGECHETRVFDSGVGDSTLKNDLIVTYFSGTKEDVYKKNAKMDSYSYGVEQERVTYETMDNGVRVVYDLGSEKVTHKDFPVQISDERMQNLIIQYIDDKQMKTLKKQYRQLADGSWARIATDEYPLAGLSAKAMYTMFYEDGKYTYDELLFDNTEAGKLDQMPTRQEINIAMEYFLDGDDLIVRLNMKEAIAHEDYPLKSISVLPYFLSTQETDGYMFIPDGSGALIYLDNKKSAEYQFTSRYWNGDVLQGASTYSSTTATMTAPIFGLKVGNHAVLGIIEEGTEVATLSAYTNGSFNSIPYSRLSLDFAIREDQVLGEFVDAVTNFTFRKASTDYYADDIVVRYKFLTDEQADYAGMAMAYREYLLENDQLVKKSAEETAPLFLEMLGEVDSTEYFLGIPYNGSTVVTSFADAKAILEDMTNRGVKNIKVDYNGIVNGGVSQRASENVKLSSKLGGAGAFNALVSYAQSVGGEVYPNLQLQTVNTDKGISKDKRSFFISGSVAEIYEFEPVQMSAITDADYPTFIISPNYLKTYTDKLAASYKSLGVNTLASEDFMKFYGATYKNKEHVSITTAMPIYEEVKNNLASQYKLMLSNPVSEAWDQATYLMDIPYDGTNLKVIDCYIPFLQMVFSGTTTYASEVLNDNSHNMTKELMKSIESGSAMKFRVIATDTINLQETELDNVFLAEYNTLKENIAGLYAEYSEFYNKVAGASISNHELVEKDGSVVHVTWSNGVNVYLNYSEESITVDGVAVPAGSYVVR